MKRSMISKSLSERVYDSNRVIQICIASDFTDPSCAVQDIEEPHPEGLSAIDGAGQFYALAPFICVKAHPLFPLEREELAPQRLGGVRINPSFFRIRVIFPLKIKEFNSELWFA